MFAMQYEPNIIQLTVSFSVWPEVFAMGRVITVGYLDVSIFLVKQVKATTYECAPEEVEEVICH